MRPTPNHGILEIAPYVGGKSTSNSAIKTIKLSSNETPLGASPKAIEAYKEVVTNLHRYPDGSAYKLREAISDIYELPLKKIVCGAGSDELIGLLVHAYVNKGDEVIISKHGFLMYKIYAQSVGAKVIAATEKELRTDVDAILATISPKTKIIFIANPNNPTGSYITTSELKRLHAGIPKNVILAIDDAYCEYVEADDYSDGSTLVKNNENVVMLRTFSKIYGLSALRLGWMFAPEHIIDVINRIRGPFNISTPAIEAGIAAVRDTEFTAKAKDFNKQELEKLFAKISELGLKPYPSAGNFLLVKFPEKGHTATAANAYLMERGLIVREVTNYGFPNCLRISVGLCEDNEAVIDVLRKFLNK
ncbi:MAG: histidinol-phosphate transaminase [Rickettsiales bacterium]